MGCKHYYSTKLWGSFACRASCLQRMKISLSRHDLLGDERWLISQRRRARSLFLNGLFIGFNLHRNTGKAHQSLSGSKDQTIDNKQRTLKAYAKSGPDSYRAIRLWETNSFQAWILIIKIEVLAKQVSRVLCILS